MSLEDEIRADFERIRRFFGPRFKAGLVIDRNAKGSHFNLLTKTVFLGIGEGYNRTALVHECLHAAGYMHSTRLGFRSNLNEDRFSPWWEQKIFEGERMANLGSIRESAQILRAHRERKKRNSPRRRETNGIA